ncbi:helix-turn-helix domain-containing protein [Bradyrhizobium sp. USDA 4350]
MAKFKVGDNVVNTDQGEWPHGLTGVIVDIERNCEDGLDYLVRFDGANSRGHGADEACWWCGKKDLKRVSKDDTFTVGSTSARTTQQDIILQHLKDGKNITQMKAMGVYHVPRLSDVIFKLKKKGHNIVTDMFEDEVGGLYASYRLVA